MYTSSILIFFMVIYSLNCEFCCKDAKIKYFDTIIKKNLEQIKSYSLPTNNDDFRPGLIADVTSPKRYGSFDFIIVGGGTAGSVIATRLSELLIFKILVLEAGGNETDFTNIPFYASSLLNSPFNWGYKTTSQKNSCLGMNDKKCIAPMGKVLGGTSSINAMAYTRGHPLDYDNWEQLGNPGWGSSDVCPYFLKSENSQIDGMPGFHGEDGLWNVEYTSPLSETVDNFLAASQTVGLDEQDDYNKCNQIGAAKVQINQKNGKRQSTANAFFSNADIRHNMKLQQQALVTKINFDKNKRAVSVEFVLKNERYIATASNEIILSAGAYNTPQLLMASGIGPRKELERLDINVVSDLPVGQNLIDHPFFNGLRFSTNFTETVIPMQEQIQQYLQGYGPLTIPYGIQALGFIPSLKVPSSLPMLEILFEPTPSNLKSLYDDFNIQQTYNEALVNDSPNVQLGLYLVLLHPKSRGTVTLKSKNYLDFPNIDNNMFSDENNEDISNLIDGIRFVLKLMQTEPMREINATLLPLPFCKKEKPNSEKYWECVIRYSASTIFHPVGTARMGNNKESVVDSDLKVYGVNRLRIADASVMPAPVSGHTSAPVVMIAEKASDIVKNTYWNSSQVCFTLNI